MIIPSVIRAEAAGEGSVPEAVEPDGMFALTPVLERSCIAVKISLSPVQALGGIRWFNNDAQAVFPKILVASGYTDYPPRYDDGVVQAENVAGAEVAWSEIHFSEPMGSATGTLYVIFQLPAGMEGEQSGVGPAMGYVATDSPSCVFVSPDGDDWSRLIADYQLLVEPVYTYREPGMVALSSSGPHPEEMWEWTAPEDEQEDTPPLFRDELLQPYPNPFNPVTTLAFTLKDPARVELAVFDLRGRRMAGIHSGPLDSGRHEFQWNGQDQQGLRVASGVYFARLKIPGSLQIRRMMLLK